MAITQQSLSGSLVGRNLRLDMNKAMRFERHLGDIIPWIEHIEICSKENQSPKCYTKITSRRFESEAGIVKIKCDLAAISTNQLVKTLSMRRLHVFKHLLRGSADLLFPPQCLICNRALPPKHAGPAICYPCQWMLAPDDLIYCRRCSAVAAVGPKGKNPPEDKDFEESRQKIAPKLSPNETINSEHSPRPSDRTVGQCNHCPQNQFMRFERAIALNQYEGELRRSVLRMKEMSNHRPMTAAIADYLVEYRRETFEALKIDAIASIPLHWTKKLQRGSSSPVILAERIAKQLNISYVHKGIISTRRTKTQSKLTREQRIINVRGAYTVTKSYDFKGLRVLLVDDILTTGATCSEVARILYRAGAESVSLAVIARAQYSPKNASAGRHRNNSPEPTDNNPDPQADNF